MSERSPKLYLQDILDAINVLEEYTQGISFEEFRKDRRTIDAAVRNLEILGEAARNMPVEFTEKHPKFLGEAW